MAAAIGEESDEQLARRLQAEEFAAMGLSPVDRQAADNLSYSYPAVSDPAVAPQRSYSHSQPQSAQPSPLSSPALRGAAHPLLPSGRYRPAQRVRQNAIDNISQAPAQHSNRILTLYFLYACAELVTSITLLSLHWHDSCNVPIRIWIVLHSARWLLFLPLAVHQRTVAASSPSGAVVNDRSRRLKLWLKYAVFVIWIIGLYWLFTADADQCRSEGNGVLFTYAIVLASLYGVRLALPLFFVLLLCLCLPCVLVFMTKLQSNPGASRDTIQRLPTRTFTRSASQSAASASSPSSRGSGDGTTQPDAETPSCAICMQEYEDGDVLRILPCEPIHHEFHQQCCDRWLESNYTCPLCRTAVSQEGRDEQERERQREREQERLDREAREEQDRLDSDMASPPNHHQDDAIIRRTLDIV